MIKIKNRLLLILIFSFILSLTYSFYFKIKPTVDARAYDTIAMNLVEGRGYRENINVAVEYDYAMARVGPLYEFFLAGIYKIFGHHYEIIWVIQAILHALTTYLVYLTTVLVFKDYEHQETVGLFAAIIIGFYPDLIEISAMLMTETLYLFLFCLALYLFFKQFEKTKIWLAILTGFIFGLSILARPPILFLIPVVLFFFFKKKRFLIGLLFCFALFVVFVPWSVRNYKVYGEFMPLGAAGAYNFWIGNYHGGNGEQEPIQMHYDFTVTHRIRELQTESLNQFRKFVRDYPIEFFKLTLLRINKYFSITRPMGFWFYQSGFGQLIFVAVSGAASIFLFIFGLAGLVNALLIINRESIRYLFTFFIITPLIIFVTVVETRYRFQIYPLLAPFAAYYLIYLWQKRDWRLEKTFWLSAMFIFLNGWLDFSLNLNKFKEKISSFFNF